MAGGAVGLMVILRSLPAGVGEGFPKLSVAMDGDSQASHGGAARSVFWKALADTGLLLLQRFFSVSSSSERLLITAEG